MLLLEAAGDGVPVPEPDLGTFFFGGLLLLLLLLLPTVFLFEVG